MAPLSPVSPPTRALVTGASSGIGAAVARRLAARGVEVWLAARRPERLEAEVKAIEALGGRAHSVLIDVSQPEETAAAVERLDDACGGLDLVVANAGIGGGGKLVSKTSWQDVQRIFQTNLVGSLATLLPLVPRMLERAKSGRRGHLAGVSSMGAELPLAGAADYGASKAAFSFFLECAQCELPAKGVDVTIIHPGFVKSELTAKNRFDMPFLLETDEAARIIDDALAARARIVRFPLGLVSLINAGKILPRALKNAIVGRNLPKD